MADQLNPIMINLKDAMELAEMAKKGIGKAVREFQDMVDNVLEGDLVTPEGVRISQNKVSNEGMPTRMEMASTGSGGQGVDRPTFEAYKPTREEEAILRSGRSIDLRERDPRFVLKLVKESDKRIYENLTPEQFKEQVKIAKELARYVRESRDNLSREQLKEIDSYLANLAHRTLTLSGAGEGGAIKDHIQRIRAFISRQ